MLLWKEESEVGLSKCSFRNELITQFGWYTIMFEPLASLLCRNHVRGESASRKEWITYISIFIVSPFFARHVISSCTGEYCAMLSKAGNLLLGLGIDSSGGIACWLKHVVFGEAQAEIPLVLRVTWLVGIVYPFLTTGKPYARGLVHASVITITWMVGFFSESHASMWCLANVVQIVIMVADPYIFPTTEAKVIVRRGKKESILQDRYMKKKVPEDLDAIVIGSGIGGLATAALLANTGKKVLVLEQHYRAGGATHTFDELGNLFDSGIHYVGANDMCRALLGHVTEKEVEWAEMGREEDGICYDEFDLGDGDMVRYRRGKEAVIAELVKKFPKEERNIKQYMKQLFWASVATRVFVLMKLLPLSWTKGYLHSALHKLFLYCGAGKTADEMVKNYFKDPKLQALISGGQLIDWNLAPDQVSWWVVASMMEYYIDGAHYPRGGSQCIAENIIPVIENAGGRVLCRATVETILTRAGENGKPEAMGVRLHNGDEIMAPIIVSDTGATNTFEKLLHPDTLNMVGLKPSFPVKVGPSNGHMTAFVNFDGPSSDFDLRPANIHSFMDLPKFDYDISTMQRALYNDFAVNKEGCLITLTSPSAKDPDYERMFPGCSNVLLLAEGRPEWFDDMPPQQYGQRTEEYNAFKQKWESVFLERLYKYYPKTRGHVEKIHIGTPLSTQHFLAADKGASYGLEWTINRFDRNLLSDYCHAVTRISNLYQTGEGPLFGGFCGALFSAFVTVYHIMGPLQLAKTLLFNQGPKNSRQTAAATGAA